VLIATSAYSNIHLIKVDASKGRLDASIRHLPRFLCTFKERKNSAGYLSKQE
jgi:hypothetical protein